MDEQSENNTPQAANTQDQEIIVILKQMQQQLVFLSKKIDTFMNQQPPKGQEERGYSRPFRSFNSQRGGARGGFERPRRFEGHGRQQREYGHKREEFEGSGEGQQGHARHFGKPRREQGASFEEKRKPFYNKFKKR